MRDGFQAMAQALGGAVARTGAGSTAVRLSPASDPARCWPWLPDAYRCGCRTATRSSPRPRASTSRPRRRIRPWRRSRTLTVGWPACSCTPRWPTPARSGGVVALPARPGVHPGLRGRRGRHPGPEDRRRLARRGRHDGVPGAGHAVPRRRRVGRGAGTSNIKSHHNVGGLPDDLEFELVEPLRTLFKDEVRLVGEQLGLPPSWVRATRSRVPASASGSSARSPASGSTSCARPTRSPARSSPGRGWTATSGSSRSCCWPTYAPSACRATAARTATRSCCGRSPPRTR